MAFRRWQGAGTIARSEIREVTIFTARQVESSPGGENLRASVYSRSEKWGSLMNQLYKSGWRLSTALRTDGAGYALTEAVSFDCGHVPLPPIPLARANKWIESISLGNAIIVVLPSPRGRDDLIIQIQQKALPFGDGIRFLGVQLRYPVGRRFFDETGHFPARLADRIDAHIRDFLGFDLYVVEAGSEKKSRVRGRLSVSRRPGRKGNGGILTNKTAIAYLTGDPRSPSGAKVHDA